MSSSRERDYGTAGSWTLSEQPGWLAKGTLAWVYGLTGFVIFWLVIVAASLVFNLLGLSSTAPL